MLNVPVNSFFFQSCQDGATAYCLFWLGVGLKYLGQGHKHVVGRFESLTSRSGIRCFITKPPRSTIVKLEKHCVGINMI